MKKALAMVLSLVMAFGLTMTFASCGGGDNDDGKRGEVSENDTFAGSLSEESFDTDKEAVEAFLKTEISGQAAEAELVKYEKSGELSEEEIGELNTGDILAEGDKIESAQIVEVSYKKNMTANTAKQTAAEEEEYFTFTIYVIAITPYGVTKTAYHYYVPKSKIGDDLTKSYFDDVLNPEKYVNCTQEYQQKGTVTYGPMSIEIEQNFYIMVANDKATLHTHTLDGFSESGLGYQDQYGYFEQGEKLRVWRSSDGVNYQSAVVNPFISMGVTDISSFAAINLPKIDYSYYEKTDYGFKIQDEFIEKYAKLSLSSYSDDCEVDVEFKIYVEDGRVVKMTAVSDVSESGVHISHNEENLVFKDFGTTTVTRPAGVTD